MAFPVAVPADLDRVCERFVKVSEPRYLVKKDDGLFTIANATVELNERFGPVLRDWLCATSLHGELVVEGREFRFVGVAVLGAQAFETDETGLRLSCEFRDERRFADATTPSARDKRGSLLLAERLEVVKLIFASDKHDFDYPC